MQTTNPLSSLPDLQLISMVKKNGSSEAFSEICRKYENIFFKIIHKYSATLSSVGVFVQDIFDEKNHIIYNCILSFDPKRGTKLSSHIGNYSRFLALNSINARKFIISSSNEDVSKFLEENQIGRAHV